MTRGRVKRKKQAPPPVDPVPSTRPCVGSAGLGSSSKHPPTNATSTSSASPPTLQSTMHFPPLRGENFIDGTTKHAKKNWSELFRTPSMSADLQLEFVEPQKDGDHLVAIHDNNDSAELDAFWNLSIVGYIIGMKPAYLPLLAYIKDRWAPKGTFDLHLRGKGFFICKFQFEEDLLKVLENFWTIKGHPLILKRWKTGSHFEKEHLCSIPHWITYPNLPLHLWSKKSLSKISSLIGKPLYMDSPTATKKRLQFARVCIEVSLDSVLPDQIFIRYEDETTHAIDVEYAWKPSVCDRCSTLNHSSAQCPLGHTSWSRKEKGTHTEQPSTDLRVGKSFDSNQEEVTRSPGEPVENPQPTPPDQEEVTEVGSPKPQETTATPQDDEHYEALEETTTSSPHTPLALPQEPSSEPLTEEERMPLDAEIKERDEGCISSAENGTGRAATVTDAGNTDDEDNQPSSPRDPEGHHLPDSLDPELESISYQWAEVSITGAKVLLQSLIHHHEDALVALPKGQYSVSKGCGRVEFSSPNNHFKLQDLYDRWRGIRRSMRLKKQNPKYQQ